MDEDILKVENGVWLQGFNVWNGMDSKPILNALQSIVQPFVSF